MKALTWHGKRDVRVDNLPDPTIQEPTDVIVRITSSGICGSDLHLYEVLGPFLDEGDILGHEPTGVVAEVGSGGHRVECRGSRRRSIVAKPVTCDLSDPDALCCLADELAERNISVLGANAGIGSFGPHIQTDRAWLHRQVMVNVLATHDLVRAAPRRRL